MPGEQEPQQRAQGRFIAQAAPGSTAIVSAIDYGHVRLAPVDPAVLEEARRLLEALPLDRVPNPDGMPSGSKAPPMHPNLLLVGRDEDLKDLASKVKDDAAGPPSVVISGIGGVGKTQLAGEFAHRYGRYFAGGVYWLNLSDPESLLEEVAACGGTEGMDLRGDFHLLPLDVRVGAVMSEWHNDLPRLLVLDDCPDGRTLEAARPRAGGCRVLVTSRGPIADPALGVVAVSLEPLSRDASVELLRRYCEGTEARDSTLSEIADELGDLPLALDLAGRYLRRYRRITDPGRYLQELQSDEVLSHRSLREPDEREVSPTGHDMNVGRTFIVSYRRLNGGDPIDRLAIQLLARAARFAPGEPIGRRLLLSTLGPADEQPTVRQLEEREDALGRLVELGLVTESETGSVSVHKLVAAFARLEVDDREAEADVERAVAIDVLESVRSGQPVRLTPLMPHLRHAVDTAGNRDDEPAYMARFAMGHALLALGYSADAVPYLRSAVEYNTARLGATAWLTMRQRNDLGVAIERAGDLEGALGIYEPLLEDRRNVLSQPHEDVASTLTNIGVLKRDQGLLHEVAPRYEEALRIREAVLEQMSADDPERRQLLRDVAESHGNLGALSMDLGRPREAAPSYRRALDIYEGLEEAEHERYAKTTMELGAALGLLGDFQGARNCLERALRVHKEVLPEGHPQIARNLILLGALLAEEADRDGELPSVERREVLSSARGHLDEALALFVRSHGEDQLLTGGVMRAAASVAEAEGRHDDASYLRRRSDAIRRAVLRSADADFHAEGVEVFAARGLYEEAELYGRRSLELRRFANGAWSLEVAEAEFALGRLLQLLARDAEAAVHLQHALVVREAILGERHPETELVRNCLSYLHERGI